MIRHVFELVGGDVDCVRIASYGPVAGFRMLAAYRQRSEKDPASCLIAIIYPPG